MTRRLLLGVALAWALGLAPIAVAPASDLPSHLSDREFWRLVTESSEADGYFRSDNLTSNELMFQRVIPALIARTRQGGAYIGVGPEQNFTYMAVLRPSIAIIVDIRRGNLLVQLMYKALFELSKDRADFVSKLFSRPRPASLSAGSSVSDIFSAVGGARSNESLYTESLKAIEDRLTKVHGFDLTPSDLAGIEYAYHAFFSRGFAVRYSPTYSDLMTETDGQGLARSYLATEASFQFLKDLQSRNLVVPAIGDFGGPKALRAVGSYLKAHNATVSAFYLSNVEQYLYQDGKWDAFCRNVATLPFDGASTFIRSSGGRGFGVGFVSSLGTVATEVRECAGT